MVYHDRILILRQATKRFALPSSETFVGLLEAMQEHHVTV